jgi:hypothetical protein
MRSQLVERARSVAAQVFKLPAEYFKATFDRSAIPELQALLKFDVNNATISKFAPILYPGESRKRRKDTLLFQASELALVCKCASNQRSLLLIGFLSLRYSL